jgi:hypothetical protein
MRVAGLPGVLLEPGLGQIEYLARALDFAIENLKTILPDLYVTPSKR